MRWVIAALFLLSACGEPEQQLFEAEVFEPPPPVRDVPCSAASPWEPIDVPTEEGFADIFGTDDSFWLVGGAGTVLQRSGGEWIDRSLPSFAGDLMAVHGTGDADVWVVGDDGYAGHYDGRSWTTVETGTTRTLVDVWAIAKDQVWMIGEDGVRLFDGSRVFAEESWPDGSMNAIWAWSGNDVRIAANTETLRWNGSRFSTTRVERSGRLTAIWGKGPDRVWALGHNDQERPGFAMSDGDSWRFGAAPRRAFFFSLWGVEPAGLWAGASETSIFFWDEERWCRDYAGEVGAVTAFWGESHAEVWAAGSVLGEDGETRPVLLRRR